MDILIPVMTSRVMEGRRAIERRCAHRYITYLFRRAHRYINTSHEISCNERAEGYRTVSLGSEGCGEQDYGHLAQWILHGRVLQCVAVCCSAWQCVAVCCSGLRCVAVLVKSQILHCNSTGAVCFQYVVAKILVPCAAVRCNVLQCVVMCCGVLQWIAVLHIHMYTPKS